MPKFCKLSSQLAIYDLAIQWQCWLSVKHAFLFFTALGFAIGFVLPFTLLVLLAPCLQAWSNKRFLRWVHRIQPLLEAYQGPILTNSGAGLEWCLSEMYFSFHLLQMASVTQRLTWYWSLPWYLILDFIQAFLCRKNTLSFHAVLSPPLPHTHTHTHTHTH